MKPAILIMGLFLSLGLVNVTISQTATLGITTTQKTQQKRIKQGVKSGELTKRETIQLQKQQVHINRTKKRAKADGVLTRRERKKINTMQDRQSKNIYIKKHNRVDRN